MRRDKEEQGSTPSQQVPKSRSRRRFIRQSLAASAGIAVSRWLPGLKGGPVFAASAAQPSPPPAGELMNPGEIVSNNDGLLQSVLVVQDEERQVASIGKFMLRAYEGYRGTTIDPSQRVTKPGVYGPGPTFRASVGDTIQIAFLNHINPAQFPETANEQCDTSINPTTGKQIYPHGDEPPNCFRGSNTTNMHFHGTHVSPNAFSDNVLVEIVPDLAATPAMCQPWFAKVACKDYSTAQAWKHQDQETTRDLQTFIQENQRRLQKLAPEKNDPERNKRQAAQNQMEQEYDEFPQYWAGCFPYCIRPPKFAPPYVMGQAPGTHWYHAHKHGSTTIQMFNGMSGALILQGDYDRTLLTTMPGVKQKILVLQQFADQPNMVRSGGAGGSGGGKNATPPILVNGQLVPTITMQTNEVQWWRIINATVQSGAGKFICNFAPGSPPASMVFRQIAQDGVQFAWQNYQPQISTAPTNFLLGPANRVDILVQAPSTPGTAFLAGNQSTNVVAVNVVSGSGQYNTKWPSSQSEYPQLPDFLNDIKTVSETRTLKYQMVASGSKPMINDKTFHEGYINESMLLDTQQEWIIQNYSTSNTGALHPFHIHVNPFQIVEMYDPTGSLSAIFPQANGKVWQLPGPWIWWDTFPLPLAGSETNPGYIKMRTHFADFAGKFVDHCHILAHEDRGMMQLIEVVDNKTVVKHH